MALTGRIWSRHRRFPSRWKARSWPNMVDWHIKSKPVVLCLRNSKNYLHSSYRHDDQTVLVGNGLGHQRPGSQTMSKAISQKALRKTGKAFPVVFPPKFKRHRLFISVYNVSCVFSVFLNHFWDTNLLYRTTWDHIYSTHAPYLSIGEVLKPNVVPKYF